MGKTLDAVRHTIEKSQALIARNEELREALAATLNLCHRNHLVHELERQHGSALRQKAKELAKEV